MNSIQAQLRLKALEYQGNQGQTPNFREGQIFHGRVLKLMPNDIAQIEIANTQIIAKLEAPLQAGSHYWFYVKSTAETPVLQVLSSPQKETSSHSEKPVTTLLRQLGIPNTAGNSRLVMNLQEAGIPFTKSMLQTASSLMHNTSFEQGFEVLKVMITRNLPLQSQVFHSIKNFLYTDQSLKAQLHQIIHSLASDKQNFNQTKHFQTQLQNIIKMWSMNSGGSTALTNQHGEAVLQSPIKQLLTSLGLQYEQTAWKVLSGQVANKGLNVQSELKPILLALAQEQLGPQTKQLVQETIHRITGQQLLSKQDESVLQLLLQLPLPEQLGQEDAVLHFQSKQKNGQVDPDFCRILFYLQLKKLDETIIDVQIQNRIIAITIYNERDIPTQTINPFSQALKVRLQRVGYTLSSLKWSPQLEANKQSNQHLYSKVSTVQNYQGIDFKV